MVKIRENNAREFERQIGSGGALKTSERRTKFRRTAEEIKLDGERLKSELYCDDRSSKNKFKWQRRSFRRLTRGEGQKALSLQHWVRGKTENNKSDERAALFDKLNCRTDVISYRVGEYESAGLDKLPSSSSWSKEETDTLMELCKQFDLRFTVIADRFVGRLKEKYDQRQLKGLDI